MQAAEHHVVILGASPKPARYANQAMRLLLAEGYRVTPVHPRWQEIEGLPVLASLSQIRRPVQTLTLYVGPAQLEAMTDELVQLAPDRVIFNPGTESGTVQQRLDAAGIHWLEACTLVMLKTRVF